MNMVLENHRSTSRIENTFWNQTVHCFVTSNNKDSAHSFYTKSTHAYQDSDTF